MNTTPTEKPAARLPIGFSSAVSALGRFLIDLLMVCCWCWVVIAICLAMLRLVAHDAHYHLVLANSFSTYLYTPVLLVLPLAGLLGRRRLMFGTLPLLAAWIIWIAPGYLPSGNAPSGEPIKLFSANLLLTNPSPEALLEEIRQADADVVLLQEFTPRWQEAIESSGLLDKYPYQLFNPRRNALGQAFLSKQPIEAPQIDQGRYAVIQQGTIDLGDRSVRIVNWHPIPPFKEGQEQDYRLLFSLLQADHANTVIAGDFNLTQHAFWMTQLEKLGFRSAHKACGRNWANTFPNSRVIPPLIRIDHVLYRGSIGANSVEEGTGAGSDHKPVICTLSVH